MGQGLQLSSQFYVRNANPRGLLHCAVLDRSKREEILLNIYLKSRFISYKGLKETGLITQSLFFGLDFTPDESWAIHYQEYYTLNA
jgi:hypothetical protein